MEKIILLKTARMCVPEEAHPYLAEMLELPAYYGKNLDALADCLTELGRGTTIMLDDTPLLRLYPGGWGAKLLSVFEDAAADGWIKLVRGGELGE